MKTKHCDTCLYFTFNVIEAKDVCKKKHLPRFYMPKSYKDVFFGNFGYKRRCKDHVEDNHAGQSNS